MKRISLLLSLLLCSLLTFADLPFRNHRYDAFRMLPVKESSIVFIGNSITNMHEWWEAFGCNPNIINRGVSGAVSGESLANIESVVAGKPAKVFLMLGTNDLGTSGLNTTEQVLKNVTLMVDRFQKESPKTQLYIQSILPSKNGLRTLEKEQATNRALAALCAEKHITFIDLWQDLLLVADHVNSLDGLHLMASGYEIWCKKIQQYVGSRSIYPADTQSRQLTGGAAGSWGMRNTYFSMYPVGSGDILLIGDEMIHGGEWHELLQSVRVKNRGTGWGYPGPGLDHTLNALPAILHDGTPAKICLYAGVADVNNTQNDLNVVFGKYKNIVDRMHTMAPQAKLYLMGLQPTANAELNQRVAAFNALLQEIRGVEYIDLFTDFVHNGVASADYFNGNYLYGMGYIKVAQKIAAALKEKDIKALSESEALNTYQQYTERTALGQMLTKIEDISEGTAVGAYPSSAISPLRATAKEAYTLLCNGGSLAEYREKGNVLQNQWADLLPQINRPAWSNEKEEHWYKLSTPLRENRYLTSRADGASVVGEPEHNFANGMWKFVKRSDGKVDIVNRDNASYLNSVAAYNSPVTTSASSPLKGWELSHSNTAGLFILHAGNVQLNQTDGHLYHQLYNWSAGQTGEDRNDTGCQFRIAEAGTPDAVVQETNQIMSVDQIVDGWYQVKVVGGTHNDMKNAIKSGKDYILTVNKEYRQNASFYYPLKYAALDVHAPAATYVYLTRANNAFYFTALNGHGVEENCTASRKVPQSKTNITGSNGEFVIAHWSAFNAQNGVEKPYVGKFSSQTATYKIFKVGAADLEKYDTYKVHITGANAGAEIGQDACLTCHHPALRSVPNVYDGGWFFVDKGTQLSSTDFSATSQQGKNVEISIQDYTITLSYASGVYAALGEQIDTAHAWLENTAEGIHPGCFGKEARAALQLAIDKATDINAMQGKPEAEITAAVAELKSAVDTYTAARNVIKYSTEGHPTWYYILNASTIGYCQDKAMAATAHGPLTYSEKKLTPNMVWSFWKDANGKVAVRNYAGRYIGKSQDNGHADAGMVDQPEHNYTLQLWPGKSNRQCAFTIKSDVSYQPLHAQQNGTVIVTWEVRDNNASLWNLVEVSPEELQKEAHFTSKVEQVQVTTGIGNKDVALLRISFAMEGLNGQVSLNGFKGSVHHATAVNTVKIYKTDDAFEYHTGKKGAELLGTAPVGSNGDFHIQLKKELTFGAEATPYFWLVADIDDNADEGDVIDPEISAYVINGEDLLENQGNPQYNTTVFLTASTVEYLNTYGSRYYRIPAIATAKNGWLVSVTDKRYGSNGDLPNNIDVVARVSKDQGATWTSPVVIAGTAALGGDYGHGDPAIVTDRVTGDIIVLVTSKVGFFYGKPDNCPRIKMIASHDNGVTWDAPVDITDDLYGAGCSDPVRKQYHSLFVSSGAFMQTHAGVLMAVAPVRETASTAHGAFTAHVIFSEDHGKTWSMSNVAALSDADESKIVELDNGNLMIKSRKGGHPYYVISKDGGHTWSQLEQWNEITDPNCNGDLIRYTALTDGYLRNRLLASVPNASGRSNVSIFMSYDEGTTWPVHKSICPQGSGYSSLTVLPDNTIGCYFEEDGLEGGYQMRFVRCSLDWLSNGADRISTKEEYKTDLVNQGQALLQLKGVGYPAATASSRTILEQEINAFDQTPVEMIDFSKMEKALHDYKCSTAEIQLPESGKAYTFTNVAQDGTCQYLNYSAQGMNWVANEADATPFVCKNDNGKFAFVNNGGRYLEWFGIHNTHHDNKGFSETFDVDWNYFTISRLVKSQSVSVSSNAQLFGYVSLMGKRLRDGAVNDVAFVVSKNNGKDGASVPFFNEQYSSALLIKEVPYTNVAQPHRAPNIEGVDCIATFSAPFPTVLPEGMNAFYAVTDADNSQQVLMKPFTGTLPADEGFVVTVSHSAPLTFVPATIEAPAAILTGNLLKASSGADKVIENSVNAFVLTERNGQVAFYKAKLGSVLPANRAYLSLSSPSQTLLLHFVGDVTGISPLFREGEEKLIYDLAGKRLGNKPLKGFYISNGNKLLKK